MKTFLDWLETRPVHYGLTIIAMAIFLGFVVLGVTSCTAIAIKADYDHRTETSKAFWKNK